MSSKSLPPAFGDMDPEIFRAHGHHVIDWIADFFATIDSLPVLARVQPGDIKTRIPVNAPETAEPFDAIFEDFQKVIVPGVTHWNHPGFFAYFPSSSTGPGVLAELLTAALNAQAMLWRTGPAATELEEAALGWLRQLMGLPDSFDGVIYDTASMSTLHALAAARNLAFPGLRDRGLMGRADLGQPAVYVSEETHSSIDKSVVLLGLGRACLRRIGADENLAMKPADLRAAIARDRAAGAAPLAVVATIGATSTTSVDPVEEIAHICREENVWLHVDAAYAGAAAILPEIRATMRGLDLADSIVVNPHKWLFNPVDLSVMFCRRMDVVRDTFSLVPGYLQTSEPVSVRNLMDTGIQLGRRFRSLKLWATLRYFGASGLRQRLSEHMRLARLFARWVDESQRFERLAGVPFSVVCFRATAPGMSDSEIDALNQRLMDDVNAGGEIFISHTRIRGRLALRLAVGNIRTLEHHVRRAWEVLNENVERYASSSRQASTN